MVLLRLAAAVGALLAGVAAVVVAALLLHRTPGPAPSFAAPTPPAPVSASPRTPKAPPGFPAPPPGAVVFSREAGADALALGVVAQGAHALLQASALGPQGSGVRGLAVSFTLQGATARAAQCGAGCYRATLPLHGSPPEVTVDLRGAVSTHWRVALPSVWPPPDASRLMARAGRVWRSLRSLAYVDRLASDLLHSVTSEWRVAAPDRLTYRIAGGPSAVIVAGSRWDKQPGGGWVKTPQSPPLNQPIPFWVAVSDAHVVGATPNTWIVSFFDPQTPAWFLVTLERRTLHTLELRMVTTAHFMHDTYGSFNRAAAIRPPR